MNLLDSMGTLAELSITVVGFTGVVVALRSGSATPLRPAFMSMLFGFGFSGVVWAMLPQVLLGMGVAEPRVWRVLSIAFAATMLVLGMIRRLQALRLGSSLGQAGLVFPILAIAQLAILSTNVYFASAGLFLAALLTNLSIGVVLFWKLIAPWGALREGVSPESDQG